MCNSHPTVGTINIKETGNFLSHFLSFSLLSVFVVGDLSGSLCVFKSVCTTLFFVLLVVRTIPFKKIVGLAYQGNDIVFRFIIEFSSLMDFGP